MKAQRIAVSILFFTNGFTYANWASRLPELQNLLSINNTQLGSLLFVLACGALFAMPFTGWLAHRFGSANVIKLSGISVCTFVAILAISQDFVLEGAIFFFLGISNGAMDVAMNEQAVLVERDYKKSIMSSFHAFWSIGMALGAGSGAIYSRFDAPLSTHLFSIAIVGFILVLFSAGKLKVTPINPVFGDGSRFVLPTKAIVPLGVVAFCGMLAEGSVIDWSAIYMNKVVGESETMGAIAFGSFGAAMMIGRISGDYLTHNLGKKKLLIYDALLAIFGLAIVISFVSPITTLIGFFLAGFGLSTVVPIIYTTAGNTPGVSPSVGIAMASTIGYAGFFVGPPTIGYLADVYGLRVGFIFTLALLVIMMVLILRKNFSR